VITHKIRRCLLPVFAHARWLASGDGQMGSRQMGWPWPSALGFDAGSLGG